MTHLELGKAEAIAGPLTLGEGQGIAFLGGDRWVLSAMGYVLVVRIDMIRPSFGHGAWYVRGNRYRDVVKV